MKRTLASQIRRTCRSSIPHEHQRKRKGFTLIELLVFLWILAFAISGLVRGIRFASQYGPWWSVLGAVLGFLAGIIVGVALFIVFVAVFWQAGRFCMWWRPFPPVCENGSCRANDYESTQTPLPVRKHVDAILHYAYRCKCGNLYTKIGCIRLKTQWVRILSDNTVQPYLKYFPFGRWKPDGSAKIEIAISSAEKTWEIELCSTRRLTPIQQGLFLLILIPVILPAAIILFEVLPALFSGRELASRLTTYEYLIFFFIIPLTIGIGIFVASCLSGKSIARSIEADGERIRIQRFNKQQVEIRWGEVTSAKYQKDSFSQFWTLKTPEGRVSVSSEGFLNEDWQTVSDYIRQHIPEKCQIKVG